MTIQPAGRSPREQALHALLASLKTQGYAFVTPTPTTHARVLARRDGQEAADLRDVFGWNLPFHARLIEPGLHDTLQAAGLIAMAGDRLKSRLRVSSIGGDFLLHSGFPTSDRDAVFFGPDSYRFARLIAQELALAPRRPAPRILDIGTGSGVGAITAARCWPDADLAVTDVNPRALELARINMEAAGLHATFHLAGDLSPLSDELDLVLANPPYIVDEQARAYRDGGGMHGAEISLSMAEQAVPRLAPGGRFILYTGSAIVGGGDALRAHLVALADAEGCTLRYEEIDPDVFGEELDMPAYREVERIALVSAVIERA